MQLCEFRMDDLYAFFNFTSTEARSLILWMLSHQPEDRPTIENILNHPWMKMTSPSRSRNNRSCSPASSSPSSTPSASVNSSPSHVSYQSPVHLAPPPPTAAASPHHRHGNHHHFHQRQHHLAPMPAPHFTRQYAQKQVKAPAASPYLTRAAVASSYTPPIQSRSQTSLSPRSPAALSSASRVSLGTSAASETGSRISLLSAGSSTSSINGLKSYHHGGAGVALGPSSPRIPLATSRRTRRK